MGPKTRAMALIGTPPRPASTHVPCQDFCVVPALPARRIRRLRVRDSRRRRLGGGSLEDLDGDRMSSAHRDQRARPVGTSDPPARGRACGGAAAILELVPRERPIEETDRGAIGEIASVECSPGSARRERCARRHGQRAGEGAGCDWSRTGGRRWPSGGLRRSAGRPRDLRTTLLRRTAQPRSREERRRHDEGGCSHEREGGASRVPRSARSRSLRRWATPGERAQSPPPSPLSQCVWTHVTPALNVVEPLADASPSQLVSHAPGPLPPDA